MSSQTSRQDHDPRRYQGKNLLYLLLAIGLPAGVLYIRLVLGLAATDSRVSPVEAVWLQRFSLLALVIFFAVQAGCAFYVRRLLPRAKSWIGGAFQYFSVFVLCVFMSIVGMTMLEAFGLNAFLRTAGDH